MRSLCVMFVGLLCAISASAQQPAPAELIDHLVANAQLYAETLPSLSAAETIDSQGGYMIFHRRVTAKAVFRVLRKAGAPFEESRQITEVDGKVVAPGQHAGLPWTLFGGFSRFQDLFFSPSTHGCYRFTLLPEPGPNGTQQIAVAEQAGPIPGCSTRGMTGLARVDPATGHVVYIERTVPQETAIQTKLAPFARVELAPAKIGEETFWLPVVVYGTFINGKAKGSFEAHYSDFHRYAASSTILPGVVETDTPHLP